MRYLQKYPETAKFLFYRSIASRLFRYSVRRLWHLHDHRRDQRQARHQRQHQEADEYGKTRNVTEKERIPK